LCVSAHLLFRHFLPPYLHPLLLLPEIELILLLVGPAEVVVVRDGSEEVLGADDVWVFVLREEGREGGMESGWDGGRRGE